MRARFPGLLESAGFSFGVKHVRYQLHSGRLDVFRAIS